MIKKYNTASELINDYSILHYPTLIYEEETGYVGIKNQDNICIYTTSDDKILTFYDDALKYISSNTYENGIGKIIIKDNQLPYTT